MFAGCFKVAPPSGTLKCDTNPARPCPSGYSCINGTCWKNGEGPDLSVADLGADLAPILDFAIPDGNHTGHVTTTGGAAVNVKAPGLHQVTITVGEPLTHVAVGANRTIQFGVLRGTKTK
jgi:hypothetical protein